MKSYNFEKNGGVPKAQSTLDTFRSTLDACDLYDLGFSDHSYTWWNDPEGVNLVEERLHRFCTDSDWSSVFPDARISHINYDNFSNHLPIFLNAFGSHQQHKRTRHERFKIFWALDDACENAIDSASQTHMVRKPTSRCLAKIKQCMTDLVCWNSNISGNIKHETSELQEKLKCISNPSDRKIIFREISGLRRKEEVLWWRWSRMDFLTFGYRNTTWFHKKANIQNEVNHIIELKGHDGRLYCDIDKLQTIVTTYKLL